MAKNDLDVAIIGAGLNGLALAIALRMFGIEAKVYEKVEQPRLEATSIMMWPEGMQVLAALTGVEQVKRIGNQADWLTIVTERFAPLQKVSMQTADTQVNAPLGLFHRADVHQLLLDCYGADNVISGRDCSVKDDTILLNNEPLQADVIVGADGVFSQVRKFVAPQTSIRAPGVYSCRGVVDFACDEIANDQCYVFAGPKSRVVTYTYDRQRQSKFWFAACPLPQHEVLDKARILQEFSSYAPCLLEMIAQTPESQIVASPLVDTAPFESWSRDNAVLVGDACCAVLPTVGIGFSLGIENAFILAQCLASNFNDVDSALRRYQLRAQHRSHELQRITSRLSELSYHEIFDAQEVLEVFQQFATVKSRSPF
ncbi:2-polyprenyl-6-methoxyphenol hydroxylase-like FAD-dependent oxidoreductase [Sinobacterium caligoides]|uniref:2-polyprenyl-6-methoxyphenol hydroxylase-like FAD-dependent oxidoreductase n=1 Tax=Sinobacterium caligoides TaxID=933926 RepID=A0A3N2DDP7_9GAMM|nr:NAD(P)/FAD-dependent oxidoreductase [Sinobacterium caligoides]ROR97920.1 2-polyprenyl-6-methoxyphenol hydroxylase-like FAD-dependent oxidoreductase [Sinobacterium caligoides]